MRLTPLVPFVASAIPTAAAGPIVRSWLVRREGLDHPNERSSHSVPTPRGGGLACALGAAAGTVIVGMGGKGPSSEWLSASAVLAAVGWADDTRGLSPLPRLGVQMLVGAAIGARAGGAPGLAFGAMAVPAIVNAFNFMDGINGISGGTAVTWGLCIGSNSTLTDSQRVQGLLAAGMGAGFLPENVPQASMFLGDIGSYLFGAGIAVTVVESTISGGKIDVSKGVAALGPMLPYLADTSTTIVRRAIRRESVTEAHREHVYQKLVHESGFEHWMVSSLVAIASLGSGIACRRRNGAILAIPITVGYLIAPGAVKWFRKFRK